MRNLFRVGFVLQNLLGGDVNEALTGLDQFIEPLDLARENFLDAVPFRLLRTPRNPGLGLRPCRSRSFLLARMLSFGSGSRTHSAHSFGLPVRVQLLRCTCDSRNRRKLQVVIARPWKKRAIGSAFVTFHHLAHRTRGVPLTTTQKAIDLQADKPAKREARLPTRALGCFTRRGN